MDDVNKYIQAKNIDIGIPVSIPFFRPWETTTVSPIDQTIKGKNKGQQINLYHVKSYLMGLGYPAYILTKNEKSNFRKQCKPFYIDNGTLMYSKTRVKVVFGIKERMDIIQMVHKGTDDSGEARALSSHRGRDATLRLLKTRFYWPFMTIDAKQFIKECDVCQRVNPASLKVVSEMQPVQVPKMVFKQIGIDLITLPKVNGFGYVAVAIDYFSKWSEARPLTDKKATTVARFIYDDIICRHGCPSIEISDQGREFCNRLCEELFIMTGTKHRVTSPYHPQANGLVERFNRTIKNSLLKIHYEEVLKWPDVLQGVMFAYRSVPHTSTKFSPFFVLYQREPILPVDLKYLGKENNFTQQDFTGDFDEDKFKKTLDCMVLMRDQIQNSVDSNIKGAQIAQKNTYAKRHIRSDIDFKVGDKVLLKNLRRNDRKGGWVLVPWVGPYIIEEIINKKLCVLRKGLKILKTKHLLKNIKMYIEPNSINNEDFNKKVDDFNLEFDISDDSIKSADIYATNNEENVVITPVPNQVDRFFNPVGKSWQLEKCKLLKIHLIHSLEFLNTPKLLNEPSSFKTIVGDGNCLYRALSYWVTGTEDNHKRIRKKISEIINTNKKIENYLGGKEKLHAYLQTHLIQNDGVWGTDVEVFGAAIMLKTSIYIYGTTYNTWCLYNKDICLQENINNEDKCIYLRNITGCHYDVVKAVKD